MKKNIFIVTVFLLSSMFTTISCDRVVSETPSNISAKVENASECKNVDVVKLMVVDMNSERYEYVELASVKWKNDGFKIKLPKTVN